MNDLHEPSNLWESFKQGRPEASRYFVHLHHSRIYYYLLRLLRDQAQAREATDHAFNVLFHNRAQIEDRDHLLRRLYLHAKAEYLLRLKRERSFLRLALELGSCAYNEANIMDDPEVAQNETLRALQDFMQQLPLLKREVAELYFFQGLSIGAIARNLGLEEGKVKSIISETLRRVGEEPEGKKTEINSHEVIRA